MGTNDRDKKLLNCPTLTPATQAIIKHSGSVEWVSFYGQMIP